MKPKSGEKGHGKGKSATSGSISEAVFQRGAVPRISGVSTLASGFCMFVALSLDAMVIPAILKMRITQNIKQVSVKKFAQSCFADGSAIHSDGYRSYIPALKGYAHECKPYVPNSGLLHWLHIIISSNAKAFILGTYHGLPKANLQSYLDEFCFRFSRRSFGGALLEQLALAISVSTPSYSKRSIINVNQGLKIRATRETARRSKI